MGSLERFAPGERRAHCVAWRECVPDWAEFAEKVEQLFGADGVAEVLDKQRSAWSVSWGVLLAEISAARKARDLPVHFWGEAATPAHSLASVLGVVELIWVESWLRGRAGGRDNGDCLIVDVRV